MNDDKHLVIRIEPGTRVALDKIDPGDTRGLNHKHAGEEFEPLDTRLAALQELLYASKLNAVLVVLQGLDTSGKDGTIRHVMASVSPQNCRVESFKEPTPEELAHDFLWRVHQVMPPKGVLTIFNRSHYEDVLVVRVHELVPEAVWRPRYAYINAFESLITGNGTIIVKFFLHISKDEQRKRLVERQKDKDKAWKLSPSDWVERRSWEDYMRAYEEALSQCSTAAAPWYVVPADHKWYRDLVVAQTLVHILEQHEVSWRKRAEEIGEEMLRGIRENESRHHSPAS